ncbi:TetR/AcrR family transcriptional regulator [Sphingosinicella terrae]|uniref:TetR/AcrR family transcriptional regulator n=1 Tax=Sphingosinicella terrae TaxID=2172047 RepID=UPI000E0D7F51|nr:TetR/AcrR family transcriptional regulator [Sphingosinicella terrae]
MDPRIERTRSALAAAVLELVETRDFDSVTIADIVKRAGIGYATFFRHYRDKDELLLDVAESLNRELLATMIPALRDDDTRAAALTLCHFVDEHRGICRALLGGGAERQIRRLLIERSLRWADSAGLPDPPGLPPRLAIDHSVRSMIGLLSWWLEQEPELDCVEMAVIIDRLVLTPVRKVG